MELIVGFMSSKDLAQWFGIAYGTYRKYKERYLEKLHSFCDYEAVYGGVNIKEIYIGIYDKTLQSRSDQIYMSEIQRCIKEQDGLSTLAGMARKAVFQGQFDSISTARRQLSQSGNRLFGKFSGLESAGIAGVRERIWAIKIDDMNHYRLLTPEEEQRFNDIISTCYSTQPERVKQAALLEENYKNNETMSKEEYFELKERLGLCIFKECIFQFSNETGFMIVHCTKHDLMTKFDISDEDRNYLKSLQ